MSNLRERFQNGREKKPFARKIQPNASQKKISQFTMGDFSRWASGKNLHALSEEKFTLKIKTGLPAIALAKAGHRIVAVRTLGVGVAAVQFCLARLREKNG